MVFIKSQMSDEQCFSRRGTGCMGQTSTFRKVPKEGNNMFVAFVNAENVGKSIM